jgi:Rieske 2Fe-2S family protein
LIEQPTYFTSLPREYYLSDEIFERELDRIYRRQWLYFAHTSEVPNPGDYITREVIGESVVLVRDTASDLNGFINLCRHRGSRICDNRSGNITRFVCPYHQWTYYLDGRLRNAPSIPDNEDVDYAAWGLHSVHVDIWHGLVFISFARERPEPVSLALDQARTGMAGIETENVKIAYEITYEVAANWKVAVENYQECYHCVGSHPELCRVLDVKSQYSRSTEMPDEVVGGKIDRRPGLRSFTIDGNYASAKLLGEFGRGVEPKDDFGAGFMILPAFSAAAFNSDYGVMQQIRPVTPDKSQFINQWFVHEDAVEGRDYDVATLTQLWDVTLRQDGELCRRVQAGLHSRYHIPGPNSPTREAELLGTINLYLAHMGEL